MSGKLKGAGVALITPFNEDFSVDYAALEQLVESQISGGMDYLVALGTTGEPATLSADEKHKVVRCIVEKTAGRIPVVVGLGSYSTQNVLDSIKTFDLSGVAAILIVTPYYNKPTQEGLYQHYKAISEISPLPIILYNVPSRTGINMEAETVIRLAKEFKNIVGIKEASGNLAQMATIVKNLPEDFLLTSGDDALALPTISVGGQGVISVIANACPRQLSSLIHAANEGDSETAKKYHFELLEIMQLIFKEGSPGGVKALMHSWGQVKNVVRLPLAPVSDKVYKEIAEAGKLLK
jgi:4-hydroxy-tetrahydrodipicolinate synthase